VPLDVVVANWPVGGGSSGKARGRRLRHREDAHVGGFLVDDDPLEVLGDLAEL
jgi:hypothetical protein